MSHPTTRPVSVRRKICEISLRTPTTAVRRESIGRKCVKELCLPLLECLFVKSFNDRCCRWAGRWRNSCWIEFPGRWGAFDGLCVSCKSSRAPSLHRFVVWSCLTSNFCCRSSENELERCCCCCCSWKRLLIISSIERLRPKWTGGNRSRAFVEGSCCSSWYPSSGLGSSFSALSGRWTIRCCWEYCCTCTEEFVDNERSRPESNDSQWNVFFGYDIWSIWQDKERDPSTCDLSTAIVLLDGLATSTLVIHRMNFDDCFPWNPVYP